MAFDGIGRVVRETHTDLLSGESRAFSFYHDGVVPGAATVPGQVGRTSAVVGTGYRKTFTYRSDGRLISRRVMIDGFDAVDVALEYFEDGSVSRRTLTVLESDGTVRFRSEMTSSVDTYGRENGLSLNGALLAAFAYDDDGLLAGASFATGERVEFAHDRVTRRVSGLSQTGATWTSANSFDYNARGLVERETLAVGSVSLQRSYLYSDPGFLIQAADAQGAYMYDYDAMGLSTLVQTSSEVRVIGPKTDGTVMVGGVPYEYDALGRVDPAG